LREKKIRRGGQATQINQENSRNSAGQEQRIRRQSDLDLLYLREEKEELAQRREDAKTRIQ
jgi:hypothetical protein